MAAACPVLMRDHARKMRHHRRRNRPGQQRNHHAHKAVGVGQRGDASRRQHRGHRLIHQQPARGHHPAQQHRPILPRHLAASPLSLRATRGESDSRARPSSTPLPRRESARRPASSRPSPRCRKRPLSSSAPRMIGDRRRHRRQRRQRKAVKGIQHGRAVGGDAGNQHHRQQRVEEPDRERQLLRRKVRGNQRKEAMRALRAITTDCAPSAARKPTASSSTASCCARSCPSCSRTRISVGTSA